MLLHQIPPAPPYFRTRILRRLNQLGALPIKNSAYLLPANDETVEDLQWVRRSIEQDGGEAWLFQSEAIGGFSDDSIIVAFRNLRAPDFAELAETGRALLEEIRSADSPRTETAYRNRSRKLKRRQDELNRIDFFGAPGREELETLMTEIDHLLSADEEPASSPQRLYDLKGRMWVTRKGVKVDRIASAWLIRRYIDPAAKFLFVDPGKYNASAFEIRFDMFDGEFTHRNEMCTFEVLVDFLNTPDPALRAVAEIVHDIDLKDDKYQHAETPGVSALINGIAMRHADDNRRLEEGAGVFDALYAQFRADTRK